MGDPLQFGSPFAVLLILNQVLLVNLQPVLFLLRLLVALLLRLRCGSAPRPGLTLARRRLKAAATALLAAERVQTASRL
jgi:hypothetical protein